MLNTFWHLLTLGAAGGLGTLARYGVNLGTVALFGTQYPWGTFCVNILGSLLFGFLFGLATSGLWPTAGSIYLLTGFLGGFTTFSAFAFENQQFLQQGRWGMLAVNLVAQNLLGILAVMLGMAASHSFAAWR